MKILDVMPVGAPWGGPESVRFASCFASLVMALEGYGDDTPYYCTEDAGLCKRCGKCSATPMQKKHEELHHTYLTVSGLGLHTLWRDDLEARYMEDMTPIAGSDAYIERAMAFAGYSCRSVQGASRDELKRSVAESVGRGCPVLAYRILGNDWCVIAGYGEGGDILYGRYAPKPWDAAGLPDAEGEGGLSVRSGWYSPEARLLIVTGRQQPSIRFPDLFGALAGVLRQPETRDCLSGPAAYDACIARLSDDEFFRTADGDALAKCYFYIHAMIGALAEGRCFASFAFLQGFYGRIAGGSALDLARTAGAYLMDTHNKCWGAWAAMGGSHICQPELYAEAFRKRETRDRTARFFEEFRKNDEMVMRLLEDCGRVDSFQSVGQ